MERYINILFLVIISGGFALLYILRMHVDYQVHVIAKKGPLTELPKSYLRGSAVMFALIWVGHALAISASGEVNQKVVGFLRATVIHIITMIKGFASMNIFLAILILALVYLTIQFFRNPNEFVKSPLRALMYVPHQFLSELKSLGSFLIALAFVGSLWVTFSLLNQLAIRILAPDLAGFIGDWLLSVGIVAIVVALYLQIGSRLFIKNLLKHKKNRLNIWLEVYSTQVKDGVFYGLIFLFVPVLLYRWAAFLPAYPLRDQLPFLLTLANLHITCYIIALFLDWKSIWRYRDKKYDFKLFPHDWQAEKVKTHIVIKDMGILTPLVLFSWGYFFWRLIRLLSGTTPHP